MDRIDKQLARLIQRHDAAVYTRIAGQEGERLEARSDYHALRSEIADDWRAMVEAGEKLFDEAERVALAAIDDRKRLPHLERASANMGKVLARVKGGSHG